MGNNIEDGSQDIIFQVDSDIDSCTLRDMMSHDHIFIQPVSSFLTESRAPETSGMVPDWNW